MISVLMVAHKGEFLIEEAISSVLALLSFDDEIIVCEEKPGSPVGRIIRRLAAEDSRIIHVEGKNLGTTDSMITAIRHCKGDKIYLCSPGDVWLPDKIKRVSEAFDNGADLVIHNAYITDDVLNITDYSYFVARNVIRSLPAEIRSNTVSPSLMAFDRKMLRFIMPIPKHIPFYDQWIRVICYIFGTVKFVDAPLIYYREEESGAIPDKKEARNRRRYFLSKVYKRVFFRR